MRYQLMENSLICGDLFEINNTVFILFLSWALFCLFIMFTINQFSYDNCNKKTDKVIKRQENLKYISIV